MVTRKVSEPVQDALKAYLELALGLTEASKKKAEKAVKRMAKELVGKGNATATQLQGAVEDLISTSSANREAVTRLVRVEMDRALSRMGLATTDEVTTLTTRVEALERQLRDAEAAAKAAKAAPAAAAETLAGAPAKATKAAKATPKKATVVKKAPVARKAPTVKAAAPASDVPVAPRRVPPKKAGKKAVPTTEATP
jgi:polyhydroxyalkanoate synthesis regulator phasin